MSADIIQSQYDQLESVARQFSRQAETAAHLQRRLEKALHALQSGGWQGKGSTAFFGEMNGKVLPVVRRLQAALQQAQRGTLEIRQIIRVAEEEAANPFKTGEKQSVPLQNNAQGDKEEGGLWGKIGGWVHGALDIAGFIPGLGIFADGANALIYLAEGRYVEAGVSAVAMIPVFGDAAKAGKMAIKTGKELAEVGAERLAKEGAERLTREAAEKTIAKYLDDPIAEAAAKKLGGLGDVTGKEARGLLDDLAARSTRGSGDRVVLGEWHGIGKNMPDLGNPRGYITDALDKGGIYYHTADGVYDGMKANKDAAWAVNEQFLRRQAETRISRFDYASGNVDDVLSEAKGARYKEVKWLRENGWKYGYVREGNSWVYKSELNPVNMGTRAGVISTKYGNEGDENYR